MPECIIVVAKDLSDGVSTPAAYGALDSMYGNFTAREPNENGYKKLCRALNCGDITAVSSSFYNIFEDVILPAHESVSKIKETMISFGALASLMSGSGPSVFGIFDDKEKANKVADKLNGDGIFAAVCHPIEKR